QRVLQFHQLNKQIVLGIDRGGMHRALEVEREPFLNAAHSGALRQVEEQHEIKDNRSGQNRVATKEVHLDLHRISKPSEDVDVVPALFVVAARRVVIDAHDVV